MDLSNRLNISYYKTIAVLNEAHNIYLVQHQETNKIYIKKVLDIYNINVYKQLYAKPIAGTPKIIDYYEDNKQLIIIEEFISGYSLKDRIEAADLTTGDIIDYILDLCDILESLHSLTPAIIHRDIKPTNVIITSCNHAILLDFNAAKQFSQASTEDTILLGTQGYAAPEQYGFGSSSPQTDIYALGIMLKEMLTSINAMSANLKKITDKCTQINPSERYQNISDLRSELSLCKAGATACPFSDTYLPPGFRTHTPWKMLTASVCYLFIIWLCLSLKIENTFGSKLWLERIFVLIMMFFIIFSCFNYCNLQRFVPLCNHKHRGIQYLGIAILNVAVIFALFTLLMIIEALIF